MQIWITRKVESNSPYKVDKEWARGKAVVEMRMCYKAHKKSKISVVGNVVSRVVSGIVILCETIGKSIR